MTRARHAQDRTSHRSPASPSAWAGWIFFAGIVMILIGVFEATAGLVALFEDRLFAVRPDRLVLSVHYTTWGWLHLVLGLLLVVAGMGVMVGQAWARMVAVGLAALSALTNMLFLAAYPFSSTILIALDLLVIYALVVHGGEMQPPSSREERA
jgi:hypothetical protein